MVTLPNAPESVLARVFPETATITRRPIGDDAPQDEEGDIYPATYTAVPGMTDIPSEFATYGQTDDATTDPDGEWVRARGRVMLRGDYDIRTSDRCVTRGTDYAITGIEHDSYAVVTVVHVEERRP